MTQIPPAAHPAWSDILTGKLSYQPTFLGARVLVMRFRVNSAAKADTEAIRAFSAELRQLYEQNRESPSVRQDLAKIFG